MQSFLSRMMLKGWTELSEPLGKNLSHSTFAFLINENPRNSYEFLTIEVSFVISFSFLRFLGISGNS